MTWKKKKIPKVTLPISQTHETQLQSSLKAYLGFKIVILRLSTIWHAILKRKFLFCQLPQAQNQMMNWHGMNCKQEDWMNRRMHLLKKKMAVMMMENLMNRMVKRLTLLGDGLCGVYDPPIRLYGELSYFGLHLSYAVHTYRSSFPTHTHCSHTLPSSFLSSCSGLTTVKDFT